MALDNEELKKRRAQREKLRQQRMAQDRKLKKQLLIAAVVLILCGGLIWSVSRNGGQPLAPDQTGTQPTAAAPTQAEIRDTEPPQTTQAIMEPTTTITLAAAGDLNINDATVQAGSYNFDYAPVFMDILPLLSEADLTMMNFEGIFAGTPYGTETSSAPPEILPALANAGVDILQVANSHTVDDGMLGVGSTLNTIRAAGIEPVGAYATNEEAKKAGGYTIRNINGVKVAIVAFTKGMNGIALPAGYENCVNLLYTDYASMYQDVDEKRITRLLRSVQEESPDIIVALVHWGSEYSDVISESQLQIRDLMLENGVDVILGTHSHYVQAMEFDEYAGTFVCYSLGDFFSDAQAAGTAYSVVLKLEITKDNETGETKVTGYSYTPIHIVAEHNTLRIVRTHQAITAYENDYIDAVRYETYENMVYGLERIAQRVRPDEETPEE